MLHLHLPLQQAPLQHQVHQQEALIAMRRWQKRKKKIQSNIVQGTAKISGLFWKNSGRGCYEFVMNLISPTKLIPNMATRGQIQISTQPLPNISVKTRENFERLRDLVIKCC